MPSTIFTPRMRSLIPTMPRPEQSPTHGLRIAVGVVVAVAVALLVGGEVLVTVAVADGVVVGVAVAVGVALGFAVAVGEGLGVVVGVGEGGAATKFAVTVWGWSIVTVVETLGGSATAPVQFRKT